MDASDIIRLLHTSHYSPADLEEVNKICRTFPEFNAAQLLRVRIMEALGRDKQEQLKIAAVYAIDRQKLYQLVTGVKLSREPEPEPAVEDQDVIQFSDEPNEQAEVIIEHHAPYAGTEQDADLLELDEEPAGKLLTLDEEPKDPEPAVEGPAREPEEEITAEEESLDLETKEEETDARESEEEIPAEEEVRDLETEEEEADARESEEERPVEEEVRDLETEEEETEEQESIEEETEARESEEEIPAEEEVRDLETEEEETEEQESEDKEDLLSSLEKNETDMEEPKTEDDDVPAIDQVDHIRENRNNHLIRNFIKDDPGPIRPDKETRLRGDVSLDSIREHDGFITDTLAQIYVKQGLFAKAIYAYEKLSLKYPEKSAYFAAQIEKIRNINHS